MSVHILPHPVGIVPTSHDKFDSHFQHACCGQVHQPGAVGAAVIDRTRSCHAPCDSHAPSRAASNANARAEWQKREKEKAHKAEEKQAEMRQRGIKNAFKPQQ